MTELTGEGSLKTSCAIKLLIKQSGIDQSRVNCYEGEIKSYYTLKFGLDHAITNNFLANQLSCRFQSPSLLLRQESLCGDQKYCIGPNFPPFLTVHKKRNWSKIQNRKFCWKDSSKWRATIFWSRIWLILRIYFTGFAILLQIKRYLMEYYYTVLLMEPETLYYSNSK